MPAYKRKRTSKSGLSWTAYNLAKQIDNDARVAKHNAEVDTMAAAAANAAARLKTLRSARAKNLDSMGIAGRGRYNVGSFVRDMRTLGLNKYTGALGDMGLNAAQSVINTGTAAINRAITGRGAYGMGGANDLFTDDDKDDIIISHSEFLQSITPSSNGFETQFSTVLNPGLQSFAPMLAQVAQFYEEYEFIQLVFEFRSTVVDGNDNAAGTLLMATQYNPTNALFTNEVSMDNYAHSCATKVTDSLLHGVECEERATGQTRFEYVRTGPVPAGQDPKTYDLAVFQVATQGAFAGLQLGRLYVHYKVRLSKLKLVPVLAPVDIIWATRRAAGNTIVAAAPFGASGTELFYQTNAGDTGIPNILIQDNIISFPEELPAGRYSITVELALAIATAFSKALPVLTNCSFVGDSEPPPGSVEATAPAAAVTISGTHVQKIWVDIPGGVVSTLTYTWTGMPAGNAATGVCVFVEQVSSSLKLPTNIF